MEPLRQLVLVFQPAMEAEPLIEQLRQHFIVEEQGRQGDIETFYDTFDWRLYRKQLLCVGVGRSRSLLSFDGTKHGMIEDLGPGLKFWWEMTPSEVRETLREIIDVRALLPMAALETDKRHYRLLNDDEKTVVRLTIRADVPVGDGAPDQLGEVMTINELRGYQEAFDSVHRLCLAYGLTPLDSDSWLAQRAFSGSPRTPLDYGDKFRVELARDSDVGTAIVQICGHLLREIEFNRQGVYDDVDTEFLHDFRIAIRRTRSLLSLLKKQLPIREGSYFRSEFKWLGGVTGKLRDIDVYLLQKEAYLAMLPSRLRPGLDGFFADLEQHRRHELKLLRRHLSSKRYRSLLSDWRTFLVADDSPLFGESSRESCRELADRTIRKRFRAFLRKGEAITDDGPDSDMHNLRIQGKKLRYLLEFFRSLYDEKFLEQFVKQLKKIQDNLGDFNDLCVQEEMLGDRLDGLGGSGRGVLLQAAALGGLLTVQAKKRGALRDQFAATYAAFSSSQNRELLASLIGSDQRPEVRAGRQ
ncbi:MAG: CHAD domain-containing protein [Desulfofustis sp.]|jgi:CHAD domain-containing protein|nr:CHAD domain-containing protein [Desulfofustis sp.]